MDRGHKNKALLHHIPVPFQELTEKEMYEKKFKKALHSAEPKKPPKISREKVFEQQRTVSVDANAPKPQYKFSDVFGSTQFEP